MVLQLNATDLATLLRHGTKGRDFITVQSISDDKVVLQLVFPKQVTVTLQHFILQADSITADMSPLLVRKLVAVYLKWRGDDRARIDGNRIVIAFPKKVQESIRFNRFFIENDAVFVDFDLREDLTLI